MERDGVASLIGYRYLLERVACLIWIVCHFGAFASDLLHGLFELLQTSYVFVSLLFDCHGHKVVHSGNCGVSNPYPLFNALNACQRACRFLPVKSNTKHDILFRLEELFYLSRTTQVLLWMRAQFCL